jgi:hypothetical protein
MRSQGLIVFRNFTATSNSFVIARNPEGVTWSKILVFFKGNPLNASAGTMSQNIMKERDCSPARAPGASVAALVVTPLCVAMTNIPKPQGRTTIVTVSLVTVSPFAPTPLTQKRC